MSSDRGAGIGQRGTLALNDYTLLDDGRIQTANGTQYDLTTAEGAAAVRGALTNSEYEALAEQMRARGYIAQDNYWVASDSLVSSAELAREEGVQHSLGRTATSISSGLTAEDAELIDNVFVANGIPSPYNANTTPQLAAQMSNSPQFAAAVQASNDMFANPNAGTQAEFVERMRGLLAQFPHGNVMEVLFLVFRESIKQTNEDKKYFLKKLQDYNKMAEALSEYLSQLVEDSQRLSAAAAGQKYPEKVTISINVSRFDLTTLDSSGNVRQMSGYPTTKTVDRAGLNDTIKDVESMQESIRNKRQMASTAFQNFDQKANQLYTLMSSVLKVMNEMRGSTTRNML